MHKVSPVNLDELIKVCSKIGKTLDSFTAQLSKAERQKELDKSSILSRFLKFAPLLSVCIAALAALLSLQSAKVNQRLSEAGLRAWLSLADVELIYPIDASRPYFTVGFAYFNSGHSPTMKTKVYSFSMTVAPNLFVQGEQSKYLIKSDGSCAPYLKHPMVGSLDWGVVYPGIFSTVKERTNGLFILSIDARAQKEFSEDRKLLVLQQCIEYETLGEKHYTEFCYYIDPSNSKFIRCEIGNNAD